MHSKLVVLSLYHLNRTDASRAVTGEIYEVYSEICGEMGVAPLTQRRLSSLVNELDSMGLLNAKIINMGRYGRTKKIRLEMANSLITSVFSSDSRLGRLVDYQPKCLAKHKSNAD
jgi:cell division control protein 6